MLSKRNPLRRAAILLIHTRIFDVLVLGTIAANCVCLALGSHAPGFERSRLGEGLARADLFFLAVFAAEMVIKWVALGLWAAPGTYFRDGWNVVDATVVLLGLIEQLGLGNYTALRALRVLRPLRTVTKIPGLRVSGQATVVWWVGWVNLARGDCFYQKRT